MGSPYLSSNESIILSTNNVVVNTVPAEAILTNERLMLVDTRHAELRPQDIPFHAIEAVTTGENSEQDPMLSLSLVTGPGVTQAMGIVFPQAPRMKRVAERDEWAARLKELSIISVRESGTKMIELLPPWVPGPVPGEEDAGKDAAGGADTRSGFRNPPLVPRKPREPAPSNRITIAAVAGIVIVIALVAGIFLFAPSLIGMDRTAPPPQTPVPTTPPATLATMVPATTVPATTVTQEVTTGVPETTVIPTAVPETTAPATTVPVSGSEIPVPEKGVFVVVKYDGSYSGSGGAPQRTIDLSNTGDSVRQLPAKDETVFITVQKLDNSGGKLTVQLYNNGQLVRTGSASAPKGIVNIDADLKTA